MTTGVTINGNNTDQTIVGSNNDDTIKAGNGDNVIAGLAGNDSITAGNGDNTITDGNGNDTIKVGNGTNTITAGNGNDTVTAGNGVSTITLGDGRDSVTVGNNNNTIVVGNGNDAVTAGNGNNQITVGDGTDKVTVGNGNNTIVAGSGADTIQTGNGNNTVSGGAGNDVIKTANGNDFIDAGAGNDQVFAGSGNDIVVYNAPENVGATDAFNGGKGTDTLRIELTHAEFASAAVQADLAAYSTFLAQHANSNSDNGATFQFHAFDLSVSNFETLNIVLLNQPVIITSGPESSTAAELADTTGSTALDTTPTTPAGTLNFTDADLGDTHTVAVSLDSTVWSGGPAIPAATQADLLPALTTTLHDSTGTGTGGVDWNFAIADKDLDFLAAGETLTVNYDVKVSDGTTNATQTVSVVVTGANDAVAVTSGPESASVAEQPNVTNSAVIDSTSPSPTGTLAFTDVDLTDTHFVGVTLDSAVWSADPSFVPSDTFNDLFSALSTTLHDSTGSGTGGVDWTFNIPDKDLDFLSAGETLTVTYDVTVFDGAGTSSTQMVTVTMNGATDPLIVTPVTVPVTDSPFTDDGQLVSSGAIADLAHPVDLSSPRTITEVDGSAANVGVPIAGTYGTLTLDAGGAYAYVANSAFDALQVGDNPTDQFNFTVDDGQGHTTTTTLTFNITGADDNPLITAASATGSLTEDAGPAVIVNGGFETGDLTGWTSSSPAIQVQQLELGGGFGNFTADLGPTATFQTLSQAVSTTPGQHYFVSFTVIGDSEADSSPLNVSWDGTTLLSLSDVPGGVNHYSFEVVGDGSLSTTPLQFTYADDGVGLLLDQVSVSPATGPATEATAGSISFSDVETADTHTASFIPLGSDYVGTFSLDPVSETGGSGSVDWHFSVNNADIQFLAQGQVLTQDYFVSVTDDHGGSAVQDVTITINGTNDAPTAVSENVVTDVGANGTVDIPTWALAANDTDPDTTDHVSINSILSSTGGAASQSGGDAFFTDDATLGGSFTYNSTDGIATSANAATATIINNATSATVLTGTSGDDILIATNGTETLNGGGGNDILIGNSGSHVMTGGSGNDTFAFLHTTDGPATITDFNNTTEQDHIAVSASGFGGGLTAGMDVTPIYETSNDNQFSGFGAEFHFDTANQTLYFSADGTTASAIALAQVQAGVTLNPHDLLIV
jgi:VCBS repeat-containing protein